MQPEQIFWIVLFAVGIAFQLHSVFYKNKWGQLTSSIRWLRTRLIGRLLLFPFFFWLTWHWFLEPQSLSGPLLDDALAILLGVATAMTVDYEDHHRTLKELYTDLDN